MGLQDTAHDSCGPLILMVDSVLSQKVEIKVVLTFFAC
jgi:hypothetical protein